MAFKKTHKLLAIILALINVCLPYYQVLAVKPESDKKLVAYSDIPAKALKQMHLEFSDDKDVGSVPLRRYGKDIVLSDGRKIKLIAYNVKALFGNGEDFVHKSGLCFENFDNLDMCPLYAMINIILDSKLSADECRRRLKESLKKSDEATKLSQKEIKDMAGHICDVVNASDYKPVVQAICDWLSGDKHILSIDETKTAIVYSMSSEVEEAVKLRDKAKKTSTGRIIGLVAGGIGIVALMILTGGAAVGAAAAGMVAAEVAGAGAALVEGVAATGGAVAGAGMVSSGIAAGTSLGRWGRRKGDAARAQLEAGNAKIGEVAVKERLSNYGNLLTQFSNQILFDPDELGKDNVCVMMLDDRLEILNADEVDLVELYQKFPNRGALCEFKFFSDASKKVAPCFIDYKPRGRDIFAYCRQLLNRLATLIDDGDYTEMRHLNDIVKGRPRPIAMASAGSEDDKCAVSLTASGPVVSEIIDSGTCGAETRYELQQDGTLVISGRGTMANYGEDEEAPWVGHSSRIRSVVIEDGVTSIGENVFESCGNLSSVTIPASVTNIGSEAFRGCSSLISVRYLGVSEPRFGKYVFKRCNNRNFTGVTVTAGYKATNFGGKPIIHEAA